MCSSPCEGTGAGAEALRCPACTQPAEDLDLIPKLMRLLQRV